jgi:hypothetical protein
MKTFSGFLDLLPSDVAQLVVKFLQILVLNHPASPHRQKIVNISVRSRQHMNLIFSKQVAVLRKPFAIFMSSFMMTDPVYLSDNGICSVWHLSFLLSSGRSLLLYAQIYKNATILHTTYT